MVYIFEQACFRNGKAISTVVVVVVINKAISTVEVVVIKVEAVVVVYNLSTL